MDMLLLLEFLTAAAKQPTQPWGEIKPKRQL
jgi:hypothetical protein